MTTVADLSVPVEGPSSIKTNELLTRHKSFAQGNDGIIYNRDVFSYEKGGERTVGYNAHVQFAVGHPARTVWPVFRDFNIWQNEFGHFYSGAFGDKEGEMVYITDRVGGEPLNFYVVEHVIPEHLVVLSQPVRELSGIKHIGTHVFVLTERSGQTVITILMQHAQRAPNLDVQGTVLKYEEWIAHDSTHKWASLLGPALRKKVQDQFVNSVC